MQTRTDQRVLVSGGYDLQLLGGRVISLELDVSAASIPEHGDRTNKPSPAAALDCSSGSIEFCLELLHGAKVALKSAFELAVLELPTLGVGRCQIFPEKAVVDVACAMWPKST